jgi:hypothetical protein
MRWPDPKPRRDKGLDFKVEREVDIWWKGRRSLGDINKELLYPF